MDERKSDFGVSVTVLEGSGTSLSTGNLLILGWRRRFPWCLAGKWIAKTGSCVRLQENSKAFESNIVMFRAGNWRQAQVQQTANRKLKCHSGELKLGHAFVPSFSCALLVLEEVEELHMSWGWHTPWQGTHQVGSPCKDHTTTADPCDNRLNSSQEGHGARRRTLWGVDQAHHVPQV